jgi:PTH1 family peptidyl-tRNA hydrolase
MFFKVVVGLGNQGALYENTRHNMGFSIVDCFAKNRGYGIWKQEKAMSAFILKIPQSDGHLLLLKSTGFMNLSGELVAKFCSFFKIQSSKVVVVCDDITLDLG